MSSYFFHYDALAGDGRVCSGTGTFSDEVVAQSEVAWSFSIFLTKLRGVPEKTLFFGPSRDVVDRSVVQSLKIHLKDFGNLSETAWNNSDWYDAHREKFSVTP